MAGVKGRSGGRRPGAGRPKGKTAATLQRDALARDLAALLKVLDSEAQVRRAFFEANPMILRRLTDIERHLGLREKVRMERTSRHNPQGRSSAAEALFKGPA
jgi:hypothetical protein